MAENWAGLLSCTPVKSVSLLPKQLPRSFLGVSGAIDKKIVFKQYKNKTVRYIYSFSDNSLFIVCRFTSASPIVLLKYI
jgi:hypothetical protein